MKPALSTVTAPGNGTSAAPLRIGLCVQFSDDWLGGVNYFKNLILAVGDLPGKDVEFVVFTGGNADSKLIEAFPPMRIVRTALFDPWKPRWIWRKLLQKLRSGDPCLQRLLHRHSVDVLSHASFLKRDSATPTIGWVPDFQHLHLPELFQPDDTAQRNLEIARMVARCTRVIVSSESARADLLGIAPEVEPRVDVLRFVGYTPASVGVLDRKTLEVRYGYNGDYFFLPNQYWSHKNHLAVIRAVAALRQQGREILVISTGKTADHRQPAYFETVRDEIARHGIADAYRVLGVVPYEDVVSLMHHAFCVINPSLFEGWSTTVEEAKAAGKPMVLSDIPVHREQASGDIDFFRPDDVDSLQAVLWRRWAGRAAVVAAPAPLRHAEARARFALTYLAIVDRALATQRARPA